MDKILVESQYIGSCTYWAMLLNADKIYLDKHENFVKRSYRNRAHILGANGLLRLSLPLERGKHQHSAMKDVRISYGDQWQKNHWQSLTSCYQRSPFFEFYEDNLRPFYEEKFESLFDYNAALLKAIASLLKVNLPFEYTTEYYREAPDGFIDLRSFIMPGKQPVADNPTYQQVFADRFNFVNDLCVLDLLFNLGPSAKDYLVNLRS